MENLFGMNIIPENDTERVAALERYQIVDSHREVAFQSICELACIQFDCPISHISFLDKDTEYVHASHGFEGIHHVDRGIGFCALAVLKPELLIIEDTLADPLFATHPFVIDNLRIRFYAGAPIITPDGFIIGTFCLIDTKPRQLTDKEETLLQKMSNLVMEQTELRYNNLSLVQQRDEFIAIAGHEMRTPLTTLKASVQILSGRGEKLGQIEQKMIAQANRGVDKLSRLVGEMFDASRLSEKKFTLNRSIFTMQKAIDNGCNFVSLPADYHIEISGQIDAEVLADEHRIEQVIGNIVENAMKYAPNFKTMTIHVEELLDKIRINFTDRGPGIPKDKLSQIFRRFYRTDNNTVQTGLGLGLYICAEIVKEHGGEIGVNSQEGIGSTFWFTLPLASKKR